MAHLHADISVQCVAIEELRGWVTWVAEHAMSGLVLTNTDEDNLVLTLVLEQDV